jgi:hypothetical protein
MLQSVCTHSDQYQELHPICNSSTYYPGLNTDLSAMKLSFHSGSCEDAMHGFGCYPAVPDWSGIKNDNHSTLISGHAVYINAPCDCIPASMAYQWRQWHSPWYSDSGKPDLVGGLAPMTQQDASRPATQPATKASGGALKVKTLTVDVNEQPMGLRTQGRRSIQNLLSDLIHILQVELLTTQST